MSEQQRPPTEEELRAAYEAELKRIRVEDVLIQTVVTLVNLGGRKTGLAPGAEDERDLEQVRQAIEGARALLPLVEERLGPDAAQVRNALSQLQIAYAQGASGGAGTAPEGSGGGAGGGAGGGQPGSGGAGSTGGPGAGGPGPAQSSGRLWVPGQ